jgi:hypothetical protein
MTNHRSRKLLRDPAFAFPVLALTLALFPSQNASASGCPGRGQKTDISVTTSVVDFDPVGNPYTISSDGGGSYFNGVGGVTSILTANTYNCVPTGDWQFNKPFTVKGKTAYSSRKMGVSLNTSDEIVPGDPHYTAPANPPFSGTQILRAQAQIECSFVHVSMMTIAPNTAATCPMLFDFTTAEGVQYGLSPAHSFNGFPETTDAQVSCNSADAAGCNDWFIEPIGSLQAVGRLMSGGINHGDFYMRFKFHVTRP